MHALTSDEELLIEQLAMESDRCRQKDEKLRAILRELEGITAWERYECDPIQNGLNRIAELVRQGLKD